MPEPRNIKLVIAYNGSQYHGWQRQLDGVVTVQQLLEDAAVRVVAHPVIMHGAGRTDAGVHALGQVVNFVTESPVPTINLRRAIGARLPRDITIRSANAVPMDFHASRSAIGKTYQYRIWIGHDRPPAALSGQVGHHYSEVNADRMAAAAVRLIGTHDFRGLATSAEQRENTVRTITRCDVSRLDREVIVTVEGNGFLYNMVRNIVGTLSEVGRGRWEPGRIDEILASHDRSLAGPTAAPDGLYLLCVHYRPSDLVAPAQA